MKIGIILYPYGEKYTGGLGRAVFELTSALILRDTENEYIVFVKGTPALIPTFPGANWKVECLGRGHFWLERLRRAPQADVYVFNTPVLPFFFRPKKSIVIALDFVYLYPHTYFSQELLYTSSYIDTRILRQEDYIWKGKYGKNERKVGVGVYPPTKNIREWFQKTVTRFIHGRSLKRADHIVAISNATKNDAMRFFQILEKKITVIYLGANPICALPKQEVTVPEKFFLFVGVIKERKNVMNVVKAFHLFFAARRNFSLVLLGKGGGDYFEAIKRLVREKGIEKNVLFLPGDVNDRTLSFLYQNARALVYPSIVEGFGFPILEAMSCGLPVITAPVSSLPEVAGDAAYYVDPYDAASIARGMEELAGNDALCKELVQKGYIQAKKFSWEKTAEQYLKLLKQLQA